MFKLLKLLFNPELYTFHFGGGGPSQTTSYQTNLPEYAEPYVKTMLGATEKQVYQKDASGNITGFNPYQSYGQYDIGRGGSGESIAGFTPTQVGAMRGITNYQLPGQTGAASQLTGYAGLGSMGAGQQYAQQATNPYATQAYMSPYMQGALAPQLEEARRQSDITGQQNAAQAVGAGAFGGSRFGLQEAERQRNLGTQQAQIYGQGMQSAFDKAQQAQQFGANLGLQGYGQAGQMASTLGQLGQQQYGQEMGLMGKQMEVGTQQQQYEQARLNQLIQDYATSQQYPLMQLGVLSNMLRGLPMQAATTQMYQAQPSWMSQTAGALGTGMSLYNQAQKAGYNVADGGYIDDGKVKKMAKGGITGDYAVGDIVSKLSDAQLNAQLKNPGVEPTVKEAVVEEIARRKDLRGMAGGGIVAFAGEDESLVEDKEVPKPKFKEIAPGANAGIKTDDKTAAVAMPAEGELTPAPVEAEPAEAVEPVAPKPAYPQDNGLSTQPKIVAKGVPAPAAPAAAKGITQPEPVDENVQALEKYADTQKGIMSRTAAQQAAFNEEQRNKQGIVSPYPAEQAKLEEKRRKIEGNAKEEYMDRLSEFLMTWGSLPGPTLVAASTAGRQFIANSIADKKERKRMMDALDESASALNKAQYLEKVGDHKEAQAQIDAAGKIYFDVNEKLLLDKQKKAEIQGAMNRTLVTLESEEARAAAKNALELRLKDMEVNKRTDFINQVEIRTKALVAKGEPANENTVNKAMTQVIEETKGTEAKLMTAFAAQIGAGANADRAKVAALEEKRKQEADLGKKLRNLEYTDDAYAERLEAARKKDKTGAAAEAIIQNKRTELIKQSFPALRDELPEEKPKPKAEEKPKPKAEEKPKPKAEPAKPKAEAAKPKAEPKADPVLRWDPEKKQWVK